MIPRPLPSSTPNSTAYAYPAPNAAPHSNPQYAYTQYGSGPRPVMPAGNVAGMPRPVNAVAGMMSAPASMVAPPLNNSTMNKDATGTQVKQDPKTHVMKSLENMTLPNWSSEEIDKRLTESEAFLVEWREVIERTGKKANCIFDDIIPKWNYAVC